MTGWAERGRERLRHTVDGKHSWRERGTGIKTITLTMATMMQFQYGIFTINTTITTPTTIKLLIAMMIILVLMKAMIILISVVIMVTVMMIMRMMSVAASRNHSNSSIYCNHGNLPDE